MIADHPDHSSELAENDSKGQAREQAIRERGRALMISWMRGQVTMPCSATRQRRPRGHTRRKSAGALRRTDVPASMLVGMRETRIAADRGTVFLRFGVRGGEDPVGGEGVGDG